MSYNTPLMKLHPDLVDSTYTMNPELEVLAPNGADLEDGMVVLIAPVLRRFNVLDMATDDTAKIKMALTANRWCTVENIEVIRGRISFIGVYKDGSTAKRVYATNVAWLVKRYPQEWRLSPSPEAPLTMEQKRNAVIDLVVGAMAEQSLISSGERTSMTPQQLGIAFAQSTADEIMALFK